MGSLLRKYAKTGIPNNSRISVFSIYLANLVYWVGFVIGVLFKTHLSNVNFIDLLTFVDPLVKNCFFIQTTIFTE